MSKDPVSLVSRVETPELSQDRMTQVTAMRAEASGANKTEDPAVRKEAKPAASQQSPGPAKASLANLHLRFKVDQDTQEVTVLMIDKQTKKVVRTIPPEELANLPEGELVEFFA